MANQLILSWTVSVAGSSRSPAQAAAALEAVELYENTSNDPVLGQFFGLAVASDVTATTSTGATRTLTINMNSALGAPYAPPASPCHPAISTPPVLPYPLTVAEELGGSFLVTNGSTTVATTDNQLPTLSDEDVIQFSEQPGVNYTIVGVAAGFISVSPAYTGQTDNSDAVQMVPAPVTLAAVYSSSPLDSLTGSGARTVHLQYNDSLGAPGTVVVDLDGAYPVPIPLAGGTIDIATITSLRVASTGGFGNSVGQITLSSLTDAILDEDTQDEAQLKLDLALVYLPPSYFALAGPQSSAPQLTGPDGETVDFLRHHQFTQRSDVVRHDRYLVGHQHHPIRRAGRGRHAVRCRDCDLRGPPRGTEDDHPEDAVLRLRLPPPPRAARRGHEEHARRHRHRSRDRRDAGVAVASGAAERRRARVAARAVRQPRDRSAAAEPAARADDDAADPHPVERILHPDIATSPGGGAGRAGADRVRLNYLGDRPV